MTRAEGGVSTALNSIGNSSSFMLEFFSSSLQPTKQDYSTTSVWYQQLQLTL